MAHSFIADTGGIGWRWSWLGHESILCAHW